MAMRVSLDLIPGSAPPVSRLRGRAWEGVLAAPHTQTSKASIKSNRSVPLAYPPPQTGEGAGPP
jgi:hypothetical protein